MPSFSKATIKEKLGRIFSGFSQVRQFITQTNSETGWSITATEDFYIRNSKITIQGDKATVECEIGLFSAGKKFNGINEKLSFVCESRKWLLSGSANLFGLLQMASSASKKEIGTIDYSSKVMNQTKADFTSTHLLVPVNLGYYGKTPIPRFNKTESLNWFGLNCMNSPHGIVADVEYCQGGPDFNHEYLFVSDVTSNKIIGSDQDDWVGEFGTEGSGWGQFWGPHGICTSQGYYYFAADMFNNRVIAYIYYNQLDEPEWYPDGNLYGYFNHPSDVEVKDRNPYNSQDKTYLAVTDEYNHRLAFFLWDPFILHLDRYYGQYGSGEGQFMWPTSVCFGRDPETGYQTNDIFVTDYGNRRLVRLYAFLDSNYTIYWRSSYQFPPDAELTSVDVDNKGLLYLVDRHNAKVYKFAPSQCPPWSFSLLGIWGEKGTADGQLYNPNTIQVAHGRYVPYPDPWVPLNGLGDVFVTESWGDQTGVRRFIIAAEAVYISAGWDPYNEDTGEGNLIWYVYYLTDFATVTEQILRGGEVCTTYHRGSLNWGRQVGSWPVDGHPHGTNYTVKITATSIYNPAIVVEKSVDVYVDTISTHNPVINRGIRCKYLAEGGLCYGCLHCIKEYEFYRLEVDAYDPDGDSLTYTWICGRGWLFYSGLLYKRITVPENFICYQAPEAPPGQGEKPPIYEYVSVTITDTYGAWEEAYVNMSPYLFPAGTSCLCGDVKGDDGQVGLGDVTVLISYVYKGGSRPPDPIERADVNNDCVVDLGDLVYLIKYLYQGGSPPECCWIH